MIASATSSSPSIDYSLPFHQLSDATEEVVKNNYSVEKPTNSSSAKIYDLIIDTSKKYGVYADTALRIAKCESNFQQYDENGNIVRGKVNPNDAGVFQINEKYHLRRSQGLNLDIHTTKGNIEYAMWLMKNEGNKHWNWSKPCWGADGKILAEK
ncbi:MAG: hypothetical protein NTV48_02510 [Candidatus Vogelbacteria bacterium]|nr:hypothetical protein [Candidatus Vogelbacteria bacterium]